MRQRALFETRSGQGEDERGFVLVLALLALLVVTLIGVLALSTSTTDVMVSGNARLREINLAAADAGISLSERVMRNPDKGRYSFLTAAQEQSLKDELYCKFSMNSDEENFTVSMGGNTVDIDVDFVDAGVPAVGYALEEGAPPIVMKDYVINSKSTAGLGSENVVGAVYYIVGYCE